MSTIKQLPEHVINQIAAGEVVERPVSVVKELVENAIDADSDHIEIYIEEGGKKLIRIVDNGKGMDKEDLLAAVRRHWTSKITSHDDLLNLGSFGFRGEALSSIASVSDFEIRTRQEDSDSGLRLVVKEGNELDVEPVGMPVGTEVIVKNLFEGVPARLKFLKHERTEFAHIKELIHQFALANPSIGFTLYRNDKKVFNTVADGSSAELLSEVLGEELARQALEFSKEDPYVRVWGWVGKPGTAVSSRPRQYMFVNKRPVENKTMYAGVQKGFEQYLGRNEKPQFILFVDIAPHLVDVNVHPQKREVKFANDSLVFQNVQHGVSESLNKHEFAVKGVDANISARMEGSGQAPQVSTYRQPKVNPRASGQQAEMVFKEGATTYTPKSHDPQEYSSSRREHVLRDSYESTPPRKTMQLLDLFIIEELDGAIAMYDQHAVHERVLYEKFVKQFIDAKQDAQTQRLLVPEDITLQDVEMDALQDAYETLQTIGFEIEFGEKTVSVVQVPAVLSSNPIRITLQEMIEDLITQSDLDAPETKEIDDQTHRRLAYLSCRSAIKAGDRLQPTEVQSLLNDFHATTQTMTCPHGRPVRVEFTEDEMKRWFKRP